MQQDSSAESTKSSDLESDASVAIAEQRTSLIRNPVTYLGAAALSFSALAVAEHSVGRPYLHFASIAAVHGVVALVWLAALKRH